MRTFQQAMEDESPVVQLALFNLAQLEGATRSLSRAERNILAKSVVVLRNLGYRVSILYNPGDKLQVLWVR